MKRTLRIVALVSSIGFGPSLMAAEGCGNIAIDHFASDWRIFGTENSESITQQLVAAVSNAQKELSGVREVVTAAAYQDRIGLDVLNESTRSIRGPQLDVLTSNETTEVVIIFADGSTTRALLSYPRPRGRGAVLGG